MKKAISAVLVISVILSILVLATSCDFEGLFGPTDYATYLDGDGFSMYLSRYSDKSVQSIEIESVHKDQPVIAIGNSAFSGCTKLESIKIPSSVKQVGEDAFSDTAYYNNDANWEDGVLYIGNYLIKAKETLSGNYSIKPGTVCIADGAFKKCNELTGVVIPDSVITIGNGAFEYCSKLKKPSLNDGISIGIDAFSETEFYQDWEDNKESYALYLDNYLLCVDIFKAPEVFEIAAGTKYIAGGAVSNCGQIKEVVIPESVVSIGDYAFGRCRSIINITIPDSVETIGDQAFAGCSSLETVAVGSGVKNIYGYTFSDCEKLKSITIKNPNTTIGVNSFEQCESLSDITFNGTKAEWKAVKKATRWDYGTADYTVHCTDGDTKK